MTLSAGTKLGPYEILAPIGAGGMGEVYRARDPRLKREVAIKVLPATFSAGPGSSPRGSSRRPRPRAALNHPNITRGLRHRHHEDSPYIVTELLEGETLRSRLGTGAVPIRKAIDYAVQIAKGLAAAHEKGIVHRDLKPENLFLTRDGRVKILDFGLAKLKPETVEKGQTDLQTVSGGTQPGVVLGTMGYMSPEQVRGKPADRRSDLFSFGTILYEMLAGQKAFRGDTAADTITAILTKEPPDLSQSGRNISPALDHIVKHCLEKDRDNRFQTAKDVAFNLSEQSSSSVVSGASGSYVAAAPARKSRFSSQLRRPSFWPRLASFSCVGPTAAARPAASSAWRCCRSRTSVRPRTTTSPTGSRTRSGQADVLTGTSGHRSKQLDALQEDQQDAQADRRGVECLVPPHGHGALGEGRRHEPGPRESRAHGRDASGCADVEVAAAVRRGDHGCVSGPVGHRDEGGAGAGRRARAEEQKQLAEKPTQNVAAYDAFLKGEEIRNSGANEPPSLRKEIGFYEQAVALDPGFAQAWAGVSIANSLLYASSTPTPALAEEARQAGEKAVALAPNRPEGYLALGAYERLVSVDYTRALAQYEKGLRLAPDDATALRGTALAEQGLGRWDASVEHFKQAVRLDPRSAGIGRSLAMRSSVCGAIPRHERSSTVVWLLRQPP